MTNIRGRIAVIGGGEDTRKVILGQDFSEVLQKRMVYEIVGDDFGLGADIVLRPIGEYALPKNGSHPCENSTISDQAYAGLHLITKKEQEEYHATLPKEE